jgi:hypothetical protein
LTHPIKLVPTLAYDYGKCTRPFIDGASLGEEANNPKPTVVQLPENTAY